MNKKAMKAKPVRIEFAPNAPENQKGATLITALVMLVVLTLLVISAIRSSTTNLQIVGNVQIQNEAIAAAQQATEQILSSNFTANPVATTISIYVTNKTTPDYTANIAIPTCIGSRALMNNEPNLPTQCISSGSSQNTGILFASGPVVGGTSWCYAQQWEVQTTVSDPRTGAQAEIHQGVSLDVPAGTTC